MKMPDKGTLYLIGGAADQSLARFVELSGKDKACIVILPHASGIPEEVSEKLTAVLTGLGAARCVTIRPGSNASLPAETTAVYLTGGDQSRLFADLDAALLLQVRQRLQDGGVVAGTSAGAAIAAETMIAGGMDDGLLRSQSLLLTQGFSFLPNCIVDTHVKQRERTDRLMAAVSLVDDKIGIGLDEDTAVEITGRVATAYGAGHVRIYRRTPTHRSTLTDKGDKRASVYDMLVSVLSHGDSITL
ncbi:MAG: cyanophycinase [Candidatus Obscuribacter sp.]|nr:cyanophycinase [Candidatus Obscuribacter sp.]